MTAPLTDAEVNHLRRLLDWVACEIGQVPDEMVAKVGKERLVLAYPQVSNLPKYVRTAVKALSKTIEQMPEQTSDPQRSFDGPRRKRVLCWRK